MIHDGGGTKKGVEYSMIFFYKIVTPLPPYMQSGNITFLQHLDKCAFSRTLELHRNQIIRNLIFKSLHIKKK